MTVRLIGLRFLAEIRDRRSRIIVPAVSTQQLQDLVPERLQTLTVNGESFQRDLIAPIPVKTKLELHLLNNYAGQIRMLDQNSVDTFKSL